MDTSKSRFKLYNSANSSLLYTFFAVQYTNAPQSFEDTVEVTNLRSRGSIIIPGGEAPWDLVMRFFVAGDEYEDVASEIKTLEDTIQFNTPYVLRIYRDAVNYDNYSIKRIVPFEYIEDLRLNKQEIGAIFRVNSW